MNTLAYHKMILSKVSFDEGLLKRELEKAVRNLRCGEEPELLDWCGNELGEKYEKIARALMQNKMCSWNNNEFNNQKTNNNEDN